MTIEEQASHVARAVPAHFPHIRNSVRAQARREIEAALRRVAGEPEPVEPIPDADLGQSEVFA